jgi:cob(I)alamin adenosyltransferase
VKISGRVVFKDLETGVWLLEGDDGTTYQLAGGDRKIKKPGARIEAEGDVDSERVGIAMVGPTFVVKTYKFV